MLNRFILFYFILFYFKIIFVEPRLVRVASPCYFLCPAEYAFGGHPYNWSGIFDMSPKSVDTLGEDFKFRFVLSFNNAVIIPMYNSRECVSMLL